MKISIQHTPNPNAIKIDAAERLFTGNSSVSASSSKDADHPILKTLLSFNGVENVFGHSTFVTVTKTTDAKWEVLVPEIEGFFATYGESN